MCLLVFSVNPEANANDWFLILISVRDEVYTRPTKLADFWENHPNTIGGRDLEPGKAGGAWLAMSKSGKIGALLNILQPDDEISPTKKGRGFLAADYVTGSQDCVNYLKQLNTESQNYNEFLLVTMDYNFLTMPKIAYFTNSSPIFPVLLQPGIHAFGNSLTPDDPWPKVSAAKEHFCKIVTKNPLTSDKDNLVEELFSMLNDRTQYPIDDRMRKQGKSLDTDFLEKLSAVFVENPKRNYGSRCHTVILIDGSGKVDYFERSRPEVAARVKDENWLSHHFTFKLQQ